MKKEEGKKRGRKGDQEEGKVKENSPPSNDRQEVLVLPV
jgi:hypothetical protein